MNTHANCKQHECLYSVLYINWLCTQVYITKHFSLTPDFSSYSLYDNNCPYVGCTSQLQQQFSSTCVSFYTIYYSITTNIIHISSRINMHVITKQIFTNICSTVLRRICVHFFKLVCIFIFPLKYFKLPLLKKFLSCEINGLIIQEPN